MRILTIFPLFLLSCSTLVFCNRESVQDPPTKNQISEYFFGVEGISKNNKTISSEDAMTVARMYLQRKNPATKSDLAEEPIPIKDNKGVVQMYAINSGDSYVLVSSTKAFVPIVAVCDGYYEESVVIPAEQIVIDELCRQIARNRDSGNFEKYADAWNSYEMHNNDFEFLINTKASGPWEAYYEMLDEWEGQDVYFLTNASSVVPNDIYQSFSDIVDQEYQNSTCVYPMYAVVTIGADSLSQTKGPYTSTVWDQGSPYNSAVPGGLVLGCLTVAVAQYMRSVGLPAGILWSMMPFSGSNTYTSDFLANLRDSLNIDANGNGNINSAVSFLSGYSYNCYTQSHSQSPVVSSIEDRRLVLMRGAYMENGVQKGHFWVCDGTIKTRPVTVYSLYILIPYDGGVIYYKYTSESVISSSIYYYFHMNWGWGGNHNGFYYEEDVEPINGQDYSTGRLDMFVSNRYALYY